MATIEKTNVEQLAERYAKIPRIEETGPQKGFNGKRMRKRGLFWRLFHATMCVVGLLPLLFYLLGYDVSPKLIAMGFGFIVPGGGFMACGGYITMPVGLFVTFYLWRKKGMYIQDRYGSVLGIFGFWILGILGGLFAVRVDSPTLITWSSGGFWGYILAVIAAAVLFGHYEYRVHKMYQQMKAARKLRIGAFDEAISELDDAMNEYRDDSPRELDEEQLRAARYLLEASVRELGDFSGFDHFKNPVLTDNRYQFSVVGMALMVMQGMYLPNFHGYLAQARRFLIDAVTDPRTCSYWKKANLIGYWRWNPDPIVRANIMLSGWMMPMITSYGEQLNDRRFEEEGALKFRPFEDKPDRSYDYSAKGCVEAVYKQYAGKEFPYLLIPCEPHVSFPTCNSYGLLGMLIYDRDHGTHYCADFFDDLYDNLTSEFVEIEGTMALRRQDIYGLRHIPASQIGYDPMADVQNYLHYLPIFPGLAKRNYALVRKLYLEIRDGVTYIKGRKWEDVFDMSTMSKNPALVISQLEMIATEYGDTEIVNGLRKAEEMYMERSKDPNVLKFKNVPVVVTAFLAFSRFARKGDWSDIILRGSDSTARTGPILTDCKFPDVLVAKAMSSGDDLDLVLYNGSNSGEQSIKIERLAPNTRYTVVSTRQKFSSDDNGTATITVLLSGRTPVHIVKE
jgi:hypothetical protein